MLFIATTVVLILLFIRRSPVIHIYVCIYYILSPPAVVHCFYDFRQNYLSAHTLYIYIHLCTKVILPTKVIHGTMRTSIVTGRRLNNSHEKVKNPRGCFTPPHHSLKIRYRDFRFAMNGPDEIYIVYMYSRTFYIIFIRSSGRFHGTTGRTQRTLYYAE